MTLILFVCRGNTCRSPMAEVAARDAALRRGLDAVLQFRSAGIEAQPGGRADARAIACVKAMGLDLTHHETQSVSADLLMTADRIYALDQGVMDRLLQVAPNAIRPRIGLLMDLVPALGITEVVDPYSGTATDYEHAFGLIQQAITALIKEVPATLAR